MIGRKGRRAATGMAAAVALVPAPALAAAAAGGFERTAWFWLLAGIPVLAIFSAMALRARRAAMARLLGDVAPERLARSAGRDRRALEAGLGALTLGLLALALAGPRWGHDEEVVKRSGVDVVIVLDASRSMLAEDVRPSRISRARREVRGLLDAAPGTRVALVTYAGDARLVCPLTLDHDTVGLFVEEVDPAFDHRGGSSLSAALLAADHALEASAGAGRAVVVISDGEDLGDPEGKAAARVASRLGSRGVQVHAIGIGTAKGARIPLQEPDEGEGPFFRDAAGKEVITRLSPAPLEAVTRGGNGRFLSSVATAFPMDELWRGPISRMSKGDVGSENFEGLKARFRWFLFPALISAALWWAVPFWSPILSEARKTTLASNGQGRGPARRRVGSFAAPGALLAGGMLALSGNAWADAVDEGVKGDRYYRDGDFAAAAAAYEFAARGIETEHAEFNLGNAHFRQRNFAAAAKAWGAAEKRAVDRNARRDASYNRGLALLMAAEEEGADPTETLKSSIDAFNAALRLDPTDESSRHNRAIAIARWVSSQQAGGEKGDREKDPGAKNDSPEGEPGDGDPNGQKDPSADGQNGKGKDGQDGKDGKGGEEGEGEPPDSGGDPRGANAQGEIDRIERMLDAREREQRRMERVKSRMHRRGGEHEW